MPWNKKREWNDGLDRFIFPTRWLYGPGFSEIFKVDNWSILDVVHLGVCCRIYHPLMGSQRSHNCQEFNPRATFTTAWCCTTLRTSIAWRPLAESFRGEKMKFLSPSWTVGFIFWSTLVSSVTQQRPWDTSSSYWNRRFSPSNKMRWKECLL